MGFAIQMVLGKAAEEGVLVNAATEDNAAKGHLGAKTATMDPSDTPRPRDRISAVMTVPRA